MTHIANGKNTSDVGMQVFIGNDVALLVNIQFRREKVVIGLVANKDKDAMELVFESKKDFSFENSSSESHFLQLFYVNEETYYKCFYWC